MQEIKLEELTKELLPKEPFLCFVICNHTKPLKALLETIISSSVKEIYFCGKFSKAWDKVTDEICKRHKNDGSRSSDWCITKDNLAIDDTIGYILYEELCDIGDSLKRIIIYDDETLKNFIIKRVEQEAKQILKED